MLLGTIVQFILYGLFWLTVLLAVGGVFLAWKGRHGAEVNLEPWLAGLALMAASAPYVGLFGTVWHIIEALGGIGSGNLNVAAIAKPIGDALYATLWGLGCAIPALVAHRAALLLSGPRVAGVSHSSSLVTGNATMTASQAEVPAPQQTTPGTEA